MKLNHSLLLIILLLGIVFIFTLLYLNKNNSQKVIYINIQEVYEKGYKQACKDLYNGKLKYKLIYNLDGSMQWKQIEYLNAWDDKNYFDKIATCPRCGSMHITGNVPRDRGVVTSYICLDCHYRWKIRKK